MEEFDSVLTNNNITIGGSAGNNHSTTIIDGDLQANYNITTDADEDKDGGEGKVPGGDPHGVSGADHDEDHGEAGREDAPETLALAKPRHSFCVRMARAVVATAGQ